MVTWTWTYHQSAAGSRICQRTEGLPLPPAVQGLSQLHRIRGSAEWHQRLGQEKMWHYRTAQDQLLRIKSASISLSNNHGSPINKTLWELQILALNCSEIHSATVYRFYFHLEHPACQLRAPLRHYRAILQRKKYCKQNVKLYRYWHRSYGACMRYKPLPCCIGCGAFIFPDFKYFSMNQWTFWIPAESCNFSSSQSVSLKDELRVCWNWLVLCWLLGCWRAVHLDKKNASMCTVKQLMRFWSESTVRMIERDEGQKSPVGL